MRRLRPACLASFLIMLSAPVSVSGNSCLAEQAKSVSRPAAPTQSRGYLTTPQELRLIAEQGKRGIEPYRSAVRKTLEFANRPWAWSPIIGRAMCSRPTENTISDAIDETGADQQRKSASEPEYLSQGSVLVYAKALAFHLSGEERYAREAMSGIEGLLKITSFGAFGASPPAERQCQLNLSWYVPGFIRAADLLEVYPPWAASRMKRDFQEWLARVVYPTVSFTAEVSVSNWGAAATNACSYISDYLWDRPDLRLVSYNPSNYSTRTTTRTPAEAYEHAIQLTLERMNGIRAEAVGGSMQACDRDPRTKSMIRPDGGIPDELRRGSTGCGGSRILLDDKSNMYSQTHLQNVIAQAELIWRRGDRRIYENLATQKSFITYQGPDGLMLRAALPAGRGSLRHAVLFIIAAPSRQRPRALRSALEVAYRYYRDPAMLNAVLGTRPNSGGRAMSFETLTHVFVPGQNPGPPPVVDPPKQIAGAADAQL
jgi:hypothetical protein